MVAAAIVTHSVGIGLRYGVWYQIVVCDVSTGYVWYKRNIWPLS